MGSRNQTDAFIGVSSRAYHGYRQLVLTEQAFNIFNIVVLIINHYRPDHISQFLR
jgi:hypothetical protein